MTVRELGERLDAHEFGEWMEFAQFEPFGGPIEDLRSGQIVATLANIHRQKGAEPVKPLDYFPWHKEPEAIDPSMQIKALMSQGRRVVGNG